MNIFKYVFLGTLYFLFMFLQMGQFTLVILPTALIPNAAFVLLFLAAFLRGHPVGVILGFSLGILFDIYEENLLGSHSLAYVVALRLAEQLGENTEDSLVPLLSSFLVTSLVYYLILYLVVPWFEVVASTGIDLVSVLTALIRDTVFLFILRMVLGPFLMRVLPK